ncbi:MAG: NADH-quinone oxidoreductase subunit H [Spirochaetales bacterium]|nr:NADH-quinone oxidoreductase subunit H [Spirochaetales bacterium]
MEPSIPLRIAYAFVSLAVITVYGLLLIGSMARISAKVQGRVGQPVWQPIIDIVKSSGKRNSISHGIMFWLGPVFRLAGGVGTYMFVPAVLGSVVFRNFSMSGDLLLVMYFIFFGQLGMALGASEGGHPYSALGVSRGLAQMTAFEVPFALSIISIAVQYGTLDITKIVMAQQGGFMNWTLFTNPLAVVAAMIAFLGMSGHNPFSVVIAPQEIPIGPPTEYQSNLLGMLQTNRAVFNGAKLVLYMNLFFGGATNVPVMVAKTFLIYFVNIFVGQAFPRFRTDQAIRFFLGVPTLIGIGAVLYTAF